MKSQILTKEKEKWLILTPEGDFEEEVLKLFEGKENTWRGEFTQCQSGYARSWNAECGHANDLIIKFPTHQ